jgi:hypothetical protein
MTRFAAILLALSLAAGGALAASPEAAYLAARDKAVAEVKALEAAKASESAINAAQDRALADLTKRLKEVVGPVSVKGFPPPDQLNIALSVYQQGYGSLDGLFSYGKADQALLVTTRALLTSWLEGKGKEEDNELRLPQDVVAAARQDNFYTFSISSDAAFSKYADLPVTKPTGADLAVATFGVFAQATGPWPPDAIVATVVKSERFFVAEIRRKPIGKIPACEALWAKAKRAGPDAEEEADRDYRACFNARAPKERFLAGLTEEAQTLVDRLAGE